MTMSSRGYLGWSNEAILERGLISMKKLIAILMTVCLLAGMVSAYAGGSSWHCNVCNEDRDTEWCPICGTHRPDDESQVWICPTCGKEVPAEYNFCGDDGTPKTISSGAWPVREMRGVGVVLRKGPSTKTRRMAFYGPDSKDYAEEYSYLPAKVSSATALFREGNYILVDLVYEGSTHRCVYFNENVLNYNNVDDVLLTRYKARALSETVVRTGPGDDYDEVINSNYIDGRGVKITAKVRLEMNMEIDVFFEMNEWLFIEFVSSIGLIRAWVPAYCVKSI